MSHKLLPVRTEYCSACNATTKWMMEVRDGGNYYVCIGDERHPERHLPGCGRETPVSEFLDRHGVKHES